ncbi:MAG TPA: hypothetical protein VNW50_12990 [Streptosporangiaceae bacterium]|jgi:hypothetical protein|nr:hypothetical protein [Streptosporangiaceae bacterium]
MTWTWQLEKEDGTVISARELSKETFSSQGDAESWLGEHFPSLLKAGVDQVTLTEDGRVEYGPMSLHPAQE